MAMLERRKFRALLLVAALIGAVLLLGLSLTGCAYEYHSSKILSDAADQPQRNVLVTFFPLAPVFPYVAAVGKIVTTKPVAVKSGRGDGAFTVQLAAGTLTSR
jgi:hypothetical protein